MASALAYRPSTAGGVNTPARRPSAVSAHSYRSTQAASTPSSEEQATFAPNRDVNRGPETARAALSNFHRPRLSTKQDNPSKKRKRRVQPQYSAESEEKHVEYILVASFDIDEGSIMEHQYPAPIGGDEHMLAELMLPDGAHQRSQDWTMFFLHKETSEEEQAELDARREKRALEQRGRRADNVRGDEDDLESAISAEDDDMRSVEGPPLVYVLNLVVTKQDKTARRYATVAGLNLEVG